MKALVSICIPVYNAERYVLQTIDNLLQQSYAQLEIIVVNDGSTDGSAALLGTVKDERVKIFTCENRGAAAARNYAYRQSKGAFIKFMDADDFLSTHTISEQVQALAGNEASVASAKWGRFFKDDATDFVPAPEKVWKTMPGIDWLVESLIDNGTNMTQPGIFLIPAGVIEKAGLWDESLSLIDDFDFMTRIIAASDSVIFCENATLLYRGGMTGSLSMKRSKAHLQSAFTAQVKGTGTILKYRDDARSRLACANALQQWVYAFPAEQKELSNIIQQKITALGGATIQPDGGRLYLMLQKIFGTRMTSAFRNFINKYRKVDIRDSKFLQPKKIQE